jgi:hypothetical protein
MLSALGMLALMAVAALAIDVSNFYVLKNRLQIAADSAALAAAFNLPDETQARNTATAYADLNLPSAHFGNVIEDADIEIGTWDSNTRTFDPAGNPANSVRVATSMTEGRGNSAPIFFAAVLGLEAPDLRASAVSARLPVSQIAGLPLAVRVPGFGDVSPDIPEKPGPSEAANGSEFEIGEKLTLFYFGTGPAPPVHLVLDVEAAGCSCNISKIFKGEEPPYSMQFGDQYTVVGEGTGGGGFGAALEDRLDLATDHPDRTILVAVADLTGDSRNASGDLTGNIEIVDFIAVHLDQIVGGRLEGTILQIDVKSGTPGTPSGFLAEPSIFVSRLVN